MNNLKRIFLAGLTLVGSAASGQIYFTEGFENGTRPSGWSEIYVSGSQVWLYRNGGHSPNDPSWSIPASQEDITRNPSSAHSGTYNAIFFKQSSAHEQTKLVTKAIDLSEGIKPELSFWLCQVPWTFGGSTNNDELRVYYKNTFGGAWTLLAEYTDPIFDWTEYKINLPNPSSTYYIAFEGKINWGFGTCIDDIVIEEKGYQERYVSELTVSQADFSFIPSGSPNEPILKVGVKVFGNMGSATLNTLTAKSLNTSDNDIEANGVKLYFTPTGTFSADNLLVEGKNFTSGQVTFNNINFNLPNGQSYLWLTYDVKQNAVHGNIMDARLDAGSIQVSDSLYPKVNESPEGNRVIYETIYRQDFEGTHQWLLSGEFQVDVPQGKGGAYIGFPDPTTAYSGSKVLGTDLTGLGATQGDYENYVTEATTYKAISPIIDALFFKDLKISYRRWLNIEVWDRASVEVSKDNGTSWSSIWHNNNYFSDNLWLKTAHDVPPTISRSNQLKFNFKLGPTDGATTYSGWNVDDFIVTGDYITKDVGVVEWVYPLSGCGHSASDSVTVKIANLGALASPTPIPVQYSFNNGTTWTTNYYTGSIPAGDTVTFTFSTRVNLSTPGIKYVKARTRLNGDEDASNDELSAQVYIVPTYLLPYTENFESNDGYWRSYGPSLWQWGSISKPAMSGGSKSWATSLSQNYGTALTGAPDTLFEDNFEIPDGWTLTGEFERNTIIMGWDTIPTFAYSGIYCLGTDLSRQGAHKGMYEPNSSYEALSPAVDISSYANLQLAYYRWFKVMEGDTAKVMASNNGLTWTTIWNSAGQEIADENWTEEIIDIPASLVNGSSLTIKFVLNANGDENIAEGINIDDFRIIGNHFSTGMAYLQSPCFNFTGISIPVMDMSIFNRTEAGVDGTTLYYSTDKGETWTPVDNNDTLDDYWNFYTDSLVSSIGLDGWNGLGSGWENTRHLLPAALANNSSVIFRLGFKADKTNNDFGGTAIDNFKLLQAPFDVGVESILSPSTTCDLSQNQSIQVRLKNFGIQDMEAGDTIIVGIDIDHPMVPDSFTDTLVLSSTLAVNSHLDYTISKTFNMSVSGDYQVTAFTKIENNPVFYHPEPNDTASTLITVQKPYVELGNDIYSYNPENIVLDATNPDPTVTYKWYKSPDLTTVIGTNPTYAIADHDGGKYLVTLTNSIPCSSTDSVTVNRIIRDVGISTLVSPTSSCELSDETPLSVYVKNYGSDTLMSSDDEIYLHYTFNGNPQVDTTWTITQNLLPGDSLLFTFNQTFDMQAVGSYPLHVWANTTLDEDAANDGPNTTIDVWGYPTFSLYQTMGLPKDSVSVTLTSYTLDAGPTWDGYLWHNDSSTLQTYDMIETGWGVVTVQDNHGCPATDSVYVDLQFSDVSVDEVVSPLTSCEIPGTTYPHIKIRNSGTNPISAGTDITLKYRLNGDLKESSILTLPSSWNANEVMDVEFSVGVDISAPGTYSLDFIATTASDDKPENDSIRHEITVFGTPSLELGDSVFTRNTSYNLDAGSGHESYSWSTGETTQQISVTQTNTYWVEVVDDGICSVRDTVVVTFLRHDYSITEIVNPVTSCSTPIPQPVSVKLTNTGNDTLKSGQSIILGYQIDDEYFAYENHTLLSNLNPGQFLLYTFADPVDLSAPANLQVLAYSYFPDDANASNDTLLVSIEIMESPTIDLGEDRVDRTGSITLDGGEGADYSYLWQDNSTNRFLIVENTGDYWVTTTAPNGCFDQDTVHLTMLKPDYRVSAILSPSSACSLSNAESIQVEIENLGTDTILVGQNIFVSYEVNSILQQTQSITMTSKFKPGDKVYHTFSKTYNMANPGSYIIKAYTSFSGDLNPFNNATTAPITNYGPPQVNLGDDLAFCDGSSAILDAGPGMASYLWNTGAISQTINVSTPGEYSVEVTDSHGCTNSDNIHITVNGLPTVTHLPLDPVCLDAEAFTLTGGNPAGGSYTGSGVSGGTTFTPSGAGVGTHTLTYLYTDGNGCSNSTNMDITVNALPVVNLGSNQSIEEPLTLDAGAGFAAYQWQDGSTSQTYTVEATGLYSVTVTDGNGCQAYDEVYITFLETLDVIVSDLISPTDKCYDEVDEPVTVELTNRGTKTFTTGEQLNVSYQVGSAQPVTETLTFSGSFAQNDKLQFTFSNNLALSTGNHTFKCYTSIAGEDGEIISYNVMVYNLPNLNLGADTIRHSLPYVLQAGVEAQTYLWSTGATGTASITVSQWGKYWLTITDSHGCVASDTTVIWWPIGVEELPGTNDKVYIFPNPADKKLNIRIDGENEATFTIDLLNHQGIRVNSAKLQVPSELSTTFDVEGLAPGIYFLHVYSSKNSTVFKVVVKR
ncbi:MAG TPA: T9SS type A sorting domain-containing protein [Tenuifilaceae bacterium]|nr:T9SS type A sorting domain-containing protein [Tenuifilaceae bacterium]